MISSSKNAALIMSDGTYFLGHGAGSEGVVFGEICFNTAITGYQEILSDPSYLGQIITFTFPHIGNVGINKEDMESYKPRAAGLILHEEITTASNYRATCNLNDWLITHQLTAITGINTRKITKLIRERGAKNVAIIFDPKISNLEFLSQKIAEITTKLSNQSDLKGVELASIASENKSYNWENEGVWNQDLNRYNNNVCKKFKVVAIDYGAKLNIFRNLTENGCDLTILGAKASFAEIMSHKPDGVFLSNGPGDPAETAKYSTSVIKEILQNNIPLFGICLGHQLLALAIGAKTIKMAQGHRGANHPVLNLKSGKVEITSQNHGFTIDGSTLPANAKVTHTSLFDQTIEGISLEDKKAFSVQYHPESSPGPSDSYYLFAEFISLMKNK
jgi:carbamoyl-phosphate synthase small subunit